MLPKFFKMNSAINFVDEMQQYEENIFKTNRNNFVRTPGIIDMRHMPKHFKKVINGTTDGTTNTPNYDLVHWTKRENELVNSLPECFNSQPSINSLCWSNGVRQRSLFTSAYPQSSKQRVGPIMQTNNCCGDYFHPEVPMHHGMPKKPVIRDSGTKNYKTNNWRSNDYPIEPTPSYQSAPHNHSYLRQNQFIEHPLVNHYPTPIRQTGPTQFPTLKPRTGYRTPSLNFTKPLPNQERLSSLARQLNPIIYEPRPSPAVGPVIFSNGVIKLFLRCGIRIELTADKSIRVLNQRSNIIIALSRFFWSTGIIHPTGRVLQSNNKIQMVAFNSMGKNNYVRFAKMRGRGISFSNTYGAVTYLLDKAGTRTTTDTFDDLCRDFTQSIFFEYCRELEPEVAGQAVERTSYHCADNGTETYHVNGFHITQWADGLVKVVRMHDNCLIRTSPQNGSLAITTPTLHCSASIGNNSHLFVRRSEMRMHFDGTSFIVRNGGQVAGFNSDNQLTVC